MGCRFFFVTYFLGKKRLLPSTILAAKKLTHKIVRSSLTAASRAQDGVNLLTSTFSCRVSHGLKQATQNNQSFTGLCEMMYRWYLYLPEKFESMLPAETIKSRWSERLASELGLSCPQKTNTGTKHQQRTYATPLGKHE